jgi:hypothetical protein
MTISWPARICCEIPRGPLLLRLLLGTRLSAVDGAGVHRSGVAAEIELADVAVEMLFRNVVVDAD